MQTLKNKTVPWQERGRWYHMFIESDGIDYTITSSDIPDVVVDDNTYVKLPEGYHIAEYIYDINSIEHSATSVAKALRFFEDGSQGFMLPNKAAFDYLDVWVFAHKEG